MKRSGLVSSLVIFGGALLWMALWTAHGNHAKLVFAQDASKAGDRRPIVIERPPARTIGDQNPTFNGVAIDEAKAEIFFSNDNRSSQPSIQVYPVDFPPTDRVMEPRRRIAGPNTHLGAVCGIGISPEHNEMYYVDNDGGDNMGVFPLDGNGNIGPLRELNVPHGAWGIYLEPKADELFVTVEHVNKIVVYRRTAQGKDDPELRFIQGPQTEMADPHGIYVDSNRNEIFVTNHGHWRRTPIGEGYALFGNGKLALQRGSQSHAGVPESLEPSSGKFMPPSITVYSRTATGDVAPLRTIQGPKTQLNVPLGLYLDPAANQLIVANTGDDSVLFFDSNASGDVAPVRILRGKQTEMKEPSGVAVDTKRNELWVTNWGGHAATVYPRMAKGDVAPLRIIRSAPKESSATGLGTTGTIAYDPKRQEILVPN